MPKQDGWFELFMWERTGKTIRKTVCDYIPRIDSDKTHELLSAWMDGNSVPGRNYWCDYQAVSRKRKCRW